MQSSETAKNPRTTFQTPQASITMLNVEVHCSAIRRSLKKYALFGRVARKEASCLSKEHASMASVYKVEFEQTTRLLGQSLLTR